ncbi:MAG TPA: ABC transporter permease, partial [Planctomycetota bacterium]|nr:ABC transporter permease [Planctomycetota bacterium]
MNALLIAQNTFREAVRDRVLAGILIGGLVLMALTRVGSALAMGEDLRLTVDLGLSSISLLGVLVILLVGTSLVAKEIERKTIFNLLSRPLPRPVYLVGKWAGLTGALALVALVLGTALALLVTALGSPQHVPAIAQATYLAILELSLLTSLAVLFSALSTPVLSALYTLGMFLAGQWCDDLRRLAVKLPAGARELLATIADVLPNLPLFNMRSLAAAGDV